MSEPLAWNGFTQGALDAAYDNMAAVADSADRLADWSRRSALLRGRQPDEVDIPYGPGPRQGFDMFRCGAVDAPMLVFIHGGWWQRNSRQVFSCMAEGPMALGLDVALIGYTLAPDARLAQIAAEVRAALGGIAARQALQGRTCRFVLSGWSAGGHLTALCLDHPSVAAGLSISGVFDLEPIRRSYINDKLKLDDAEAAELSPVRRPPLDRPLSLAYGLGELPELKRQSADFAALRRRQGAPAAGLALEGHDHFSILEELASADGALAREARRLADRDALEMDVASWPPA